MPLIPRRRGRPTEASMTLVQHLEELRRRLIISAVAVALGSIGGFILSRPVLDFLQEPYREAVASLPETITDKLIVTTPTEPFLAFLKIGLFVGLMLALPVILFQLWRFITPGRAPNGGREGGALLLFPPGGVC